MKMRPLTRDELTSLPAKKVRSPSDFEIQFMYEGKQAAIDFRWWPPWGWNIALLNEQANRIEFVQRTLDQLIGNAMVPADPPTHRPWTEEEALAILRDKVIRHKNSLRWTILTHFVPATPQTLLDEYIVLIDGKEETCGVPL